MTFSYLFSLISLLHLDPIDPQPLSLTPVWFVSPQYSLFFNNSHSPSPSSSSSLSPSSSSMSELSLLCNEKWQTEYEIENTALKLKVCVCVRACVCVCVICFFVANFHCELRIGGDDTAGVLTYIETYPHLVTCTHTWTHAYTCIHIHTHTRLHIQVFIYLSRSLSLSLSLFLSLSLSALASSREGGCQIPIESTHTRPSLSWQGGWICRYDEMRGKEDEGREC